MQEKSRLHGAPTYERRLANGLTLLVRQDRSSPVVAIVTHVRAGYFNEPDRLVGISHVLEHMYFKGTERRGVGELARETKAAGGYLNAGTIYDRTSYYTVLPSSALELGLDIQADALLNSAINEDELRRELLVIIQEAKRKLDNPRAVAAEALYEEMFDVHPMRRWRIGREEGLKRLSRADVWEYYQNLYRPANIVVVVAGDVEPDRVYELADRFYAPMPEGELVDEPARNEPDRQRFRFREISGDIVQTHLEWGWRSPGTLHPDTAPLDLLATVLGQGRASRLFRGVREAGRVTSISAYNYTPTELGVFGISAELRPEEALGALGAIWREVADLSHRGVSAAELERAKSIAEARLLRRTESVEGQANLLAEWQALGSWQLVEEVLDRLLATTVEDLQRVAAQYLGLEQATVLLYRPASSPALVGTADEIEGMITAASTRKADSAGAVEAHASVSADSPVHREDERLAGAAPFHEVRVEDGVHLFELANGVRVGIKPRHTSPLVSMGVFWRSGSVHERPENAGITGLLARLSLKGTRNRPAPQIAEETEMLGGAIAPGVSPDLVHWTLTVPSRHFARGFGLLAEVALDPAFPEADLERERTIALSDLEQLRDDMYRYPLRLFLQAAFRDHPYGFSPAVAESGIRSVTRQQLHEWHGRELLEAPPLVLVVGDVDAHEALQRIAANVQAVTASANGGRAASRPAWPEGPHQESELRVKEQTALILGFPGPSRGDADTYALQVLSNAIGGLGGRLFEELRGRRSLAYTIAAYPIVRRLAGAFVAYIATSPEKEEAARRGILEELERLAGESLQHDEVLRSQGYTIGAWKIRGQTNAAQLWDLADALMLGNGLGELREFEDRIRAVTPTQIRETVQRYFDPNLLVEGIVRASP